MAETTAEKVAEYILRCAYQARRPLTNLRLQKLLYYSQASYLAQEGKPLFDDRLEAWPNGPVQPSIYHKYGAYQSNAISEVPDAGGIPSEVTEYLDAVMELYGNEATAPQRESAEHPWVKARDNTPGDGTSQPVISLEDMKQFYGGLKITRSQSLAGDISEFRKTLRNLK
jgi:uncharacterized phage-associated protein